MLRPPSSSLRAMPQFCECPVCGLVQRSTDLQPGQIMHCSRCETMLGRRRTNPPIATPLAFCLTSLVLYLLSITQPLMTISIYGRSRTITLFTGPIELLRDGWGLAGGLIALVTIVFPAIVIMLMLGILFGALHHRLPLRVTSMMRWYDRLRPWSMIEVYMLGVLVAYTKLIDLADIQVGTAVYALGGLMLTLGVTDSTLDTDVIWSRRKVRLAHRHPVQRPFGPEIDLEEVPPPPEHMVSCLSCGLVSVSQARLSCEDCVGGCPRCGARLYRRKPDSVRRTMALIFSAVVLYLPANAFPVMTIIKLGRGGDHTILQGVGELYDSGMLPLALLVFFASVTVPVLKVLGLCIMCFATWRGSASRLVLRSKIFRIIDFVGRWSMIDVFMISILVAVVHFNALANVNADAGMMSFASVVILTIFAADCFDPRVMWDAAGLNGPAFGETRRPQGPATAEPAQA
ncbi:paraquat-inducible membrane protein A [Lichenicoccus roseus]|uniref:Paraquat-inducible membrane protein A n=2 Tax=Lichenicoccus roseus TaxID=2683649 RepID=A0A5R9J9E6_9PROT|nr:paraquat-inducible membrane protein A [Lichenicoccus roseus]